MNEFKSSSNRHTTLSGAELHYHNRCVGKVRLPISRCEDFIRDFNLTYSGIEMQLEIGVEADQKKSSEG